MTGYEGTVDLHDDPRRFERQTSAVPVSRFTQSTLYGHRPLRIGCLKAVIKPRN